MSSLNRSNHKEFTIFWYSRSNWFIQIPRIPNTSCAAISNNMETLLIQILLQPTVSQQIPHFHIYSQHEGMDKKKLHLRNYKEYLWSKYFVTTPEPGARLVLTHGLIWISTRNDINKIWRNHWRKTRYIGKKLTCRPRSQAFFATRAAPSITLGFDVLVQLVIAAITTLPCLSSASCPWKENFTTFSCASFGTANPYSE